MSGEIGPSGAAPEISYSGEIRRKLVHLSSLAIPVVVWYFPRLAVLWILGGALTASVAVDALRHVLPLDARGWRHLAALFRPKERGTLSGSSFLLLAAWLLIFFFSRAVAVLVLTYVVVGDVAAALVGRRFGRHRIFGKSWEGTVAFFLGCLLSSPFIPGLPVWAKLGAAAVAALIELLPLKLDDNLTVPLATAGFLALVL